MSVLADWLVRQAPAWLGGEHGPIAPHVRRALVAISGCRTPALGGRVYRCTECKGTDFSYHSCNHRACPRCGGQDTAEWTEKQEAKLLPVPYFFWTFTVPDTLREAFAACPDLLVNLLFKNAFQALKTIAARPDVLGAEVAGVGVHHSWGRQVQPHPHLHIIMPGGGLSFDHKHWVPAREKWVLPVESVAAAFRLGFEESLAAAAPALHAAVPDSTWRKKWNVDIKAAGSGRSVVRYLARYVKRTAISDERIIEATDSHVRFSYKDSDTNERRELTLSAEEFMRRYLQHVPIPGQHRTRYMGWMHPSARLKWAKVAGLLMKPIVLGEKEETPDWAKQCPHCNNFTLEYVSEIPRGIDLGPRCKRIRPRCASP